MKCVINNQVVLSRPPEGPLAALIGAFAKSVSAQGCSLPSIHRQVLLAACFSRWLKQEGVRRRSICSDHVVRYLRYRARHVRPGCGDTAALKHLISFLRGEGVIPREKKLACQSSPAEHCVRAFEQYLLEVRALAHPTIINDVPFIRSFLKNRFGSGRVTLSRLCAGDVVRFVQRQATEPEASEAHDHRIAFSSAPVFRPRPQGHTSFAIGWPLRCCVRALR